MTATLPRSNAEESFATLLRWEKLPEPEREYRFAPPRKWRFDFAWPSLLIAVEVEGGSWVQGRHTRGPGFEADIEKYDAAVLNGWLFLRFSPGMVDNGRAIATLRRAIDLQRVLAHTTRDGECWLWNGGVNRTGYGILNHFNGTQQAYVHRVVWARTHDQPVPDNLDVDHLCHNADLECHDGPRCVHRRCVRPDHLEAVSRRVNVTRGRVSTGRALA